MSEIDLSPEQRTVLEAVVHNPESQLREIHQALVDAEDTQFTYSPDFGEGYNEERHRIREQLYELQQMGLIRVDGRGKPWYPTKKGKQALSLDSTDEEDTEESNVVTASASLRGSASLSATISYTSGFPKRQLEYAKRARDKAGKIEVTFGGDDVLMVPQDEKIEHQHSVVSAVVNSLGFLQGQKYWFIYRLDEGRWEFDDSEEMQKAGWDGTEDAFVKILDACGKESGFVKDSRPYEEVKVLRNFRNDLLHFESPMVKAGEEAEEYDTEEKLEAHDFPENPIEPNSTYPFKWFSYELADRSVRMNFTLWRFFARKLDKEDEFLKGVPSP